MIKRLLIAIVLCCFIVTPIFAVGPTVTFLTEQVARVDSSNELTLRAGYNFATENGGLEPFIGTQWRPRWDEEGDMEPPSVVALGALYHFPDLIDPNNAIPYLPGFLSTIINPDVEVRPYMGYQMTINFIDKDSGLQDFLGGIRIKVTPESNTSLDFEIRYGDTFGDLAVVPDNRFNYYMGLTIPF